MRLKQNSENEIDDLLQVGPFRPILLYFIALHWKRFITFLYIYSNLIEENNIKHSYEEPVCISFGEELSYYFLCNSVSMYEAVNNKDNYDKDFFLPIVRSYTLLAKSLFMLGNCITKALM